MKHLQKFTKAALISTMAIGMTACSIEMMSGMIIGIWVQVL